MDEQEEKNRSDSFTKQQLAKGKDKLKDEAKKKVKKKILTAIILPLLSKLLPIIIMSVVIAVLTSGMLYVIDDDKEDDVNDSKQAAIVTSYSGESASTNDAGQTVGSDTNNTSDNKNKIVVKPNKDKTAYEMSYNNDSENIKNIRKKLEKETSRSSSKFSEFELAIFGALMDNGSTLDNYTEKQLHCFAPFFKAEACTQYLDLRPNNQKIKDGKYVPKKIEDLAENEIPGVILVQRTNTNSNKQDILEYKVESEFNSLVNSKNKDVLKYFTVNDKGNLIVAKWDKTVITVNGNYPENLNDSEKETSKNELIITTEEIAYSEYIKRYTMPFEFLIQLLVTIEEPDFCMELVNHVLDSKIVINIQEEETFKVTDETRNYVVHNKDEKYIGYEVKAFEQLITHDNNYFLDYAVDENGNKCTNYSKSNSIVKVHKEYTNHSYIFEIIEADTWIAHYIKTYKEPQKKVEPTVKDDVEKMGNYLKLQIAPSGSIADDNNVKRFITETKANYEPKIIVPSLIINTYTDDEGNNYKTITKSTDGRYAGPTERYYEIKDEDGKGTGRYDLPSPLGIVTDEVAATDKTANIPQIYYQFVLNGDNYVLQNSGDKINCIVSTRSIAEYEKINSKVNIETTVTKYQSDPNPTTKTHIYATKSGNPGRGHGDERTEYEKFLLAYDNNSYARNQLNSIDTWLYGMMKKRESTVELIDIVKYLLYMYNGKDTGVTELKDFENIFNPDNMTSFNDEIYGNTIEEKVWWALKDKGYSDEQVAGVMGNIYAESRFDSTAVNSSSGAIGLCQWLGQRKTNLTNYAKSKKVDCTDEDTQIEFLIGELDSSGNGANGYADYQLSMDDSWLRSTTIEGATKDFYNGFERGGDSQYGGMTRPDAAKRYYKEFHGKERPGGVGGIGGKRVIDGHTLDRDGYNSVFKVGTRTYKNFQQWTGPWGGMIFRHSSSGGQTIGQYGCSVTSVAIVASGFGHNVTPDTVAHIVAERFYNAHQIDFVTKLLSEYTGMKATWKVYNKNDIIKQLKEGNPVVLLRDGSHWWVVLSISKDGTKAYVSDPGTQYREWETIDNALHDSQNGGGYATNYVKLSK